MIDMPIGSSYVFFVQPGWLLMGTVAELTDTHVALRDAVYLDGVTSGSSNVSHVPLAETAEALRRAVSRSFPLPDGTTLSREGILIRFPAKLDATPLIDGASREALR